MTTQTFLCCLPVRLGVFVLSILSFLGGGLLAGGTWYQFYRLGPENMSGVQKAGLILGGVSWSLLALFSLLGFFGAATRSRGLVKSYATILWVHLILDIAISAFFIYALFRSGDGDANIIQACQDATTDVDQKQYCAQALNVFKGVYVAILVVVALIQFYCCIIVQRYLRQLEDEQSFKAVNRITREASFSSGRGTSGYYPHQPLAQNFPDPYTPASGAPAHNGNYGQYPPAAAAPYSYSDPHNAFGAKV